MGKDAFFSYQISHLINHQRAKKKSKKIMVVNNTVAAAAFLAQ